MKFGLRSKLFLVSFVLIGLTVLVTYGYARRETERATRARILDDLVVRLSLVVARADQVDFAPDDLASWDRLADELGAAAKSRVTFVAGDGRVLGDSSVSLAELPKVENHLLRPEIQAAVRGAVGSTERFSSTTGSPMIYVARPIQTPSGAGVARVALTTAEVDQALASLEDSLAWAALLALSVALVVAFVAAEFATKPVRLLTSAASRMAKGDLGIRARVGGEDEFAELGAALEGLRENLSSTLGALREERDRMGGILFSMDEGVLFLDQAGHVALVNPALRDMLLLQGDPTGRSLLEVVRHAELKEMLDAAADDDDDEGAVQGEIRVSGLKPRHLLVRAQKLEGLAQGIVAIFMDVTETRRLENLRREFVANVSHELRTPVTSIRSAAETLDAALEADPQMARRFVDIIDRNAARLHSLVEDLLDLSRIESRQFSLTLVALSPHTVMAHVASLFSERATRRKTEIVVEMPDRLPEIHADRRALEHILSNLVDNAVKYAGEGRRVVLSSRAEGETVELLVSDNGPGIEAKHLPRLFERFYRVDAGRSRDLGGTGLGLSIVKHLVESMSGRVSVVSELGKGTTFVVRLPAMPHGRPRPHFN